MAFAFFLSERYLKINTPMGDNVDVKDIYPFVKSAQDTYIEQALGTCLYDRLQASMLASPPDTTALETSLLRLVQDALVWYTCYDALPFVWFKIRNIGLVKQRSTDQETATISEMSFTQKQLKNKADDYLKRVFTFLSDNSADFNDYDCPSLCGGEAIRSVSNSSSFAFDKNDTDDSDYKKFYNKWLR